MYDEDDEEILYDDPVGLVRTVEVSEQCPQDRHQYGVWDEDGNPPRTGTCPVCGAEGVPVVGFYGPWDLSVGSVQSIARVESDELPNNAEGITYVRGPVRYRTIRKRKMVLRPHTRTSQVQLRWVTASGGDGRVFFPVESPEGA